MDTVEFTIKVKMKKRWVNDFMSFLNYMQVCGEMGHSAAVGFFADGDGDFRPKFETDVDWKKKEPLPSKVTSEIKIEALFDAG